MLLKTELSQLRLNLGLGHRLTQWRLILSVWSVSGDFVLACILMSNYITYTFCPSLPPFLLSVELDPSVSNIEVEGECTTHCLRSHVLYMLCWSPTPCAFPSPCCKLVCMPVCTCILMVHIDLHLYLCLYTIPVPSFTCFRKGEQYYSSRTQPSACGRHCLWGAGSGCCWPRWVVLPQ